MMKSAWESVFSAGTIIIAVTVALLVTSHDRRNLFSNHGFIMGIACFSQVYRILRMQDEGERGFL